MGRHHRRAVLVALAVAVTAAAQASTAAAQGPSAKVRQLLGRMSLDEKISLVHGTRDPQQLGQAGYWPGLPRLGIPPLRLADGPPGVNVNRDSTGMPAPVGLAATFDREAARLYGVVMGRDALALGQDILLAPHVNIVRDPLFRRNHTTLSEDPFLTAQLAVAEIGGIQSQGIMAQVKHLAGYNGSDNVVIDERTLHETYLPAFEAAVRSGAASVMCAYNRINGPWACENSELQNGILRESWGFRGFITSDWGAVRSAFAITKGLDLEMPGREIAGRRGGPYFTGALREAVESGAIPVAAIDQALARILEQMERFHLLDGSPRARPPSVDVAGDVKVVRRIAEESAVLLKNDGGALPLARQATASLALIGPTAGQLAAGFLGERAYGFESRLVSPLAALRRTVPLAKIAYSAGVDLSGTAIPASALSRGEGRGLDPGSIERGGDRALDFQGASALAPDVDHSWNGTLTVPEEGDYTFLVQAALTGGSEGGGSIGIDGRTVASSGGPGLGGTGMTSKKWSSLLPTTDGRDNARGAIHLSAGPHQIEIAANSIGAGPLRLRFAWITPEHRRAAIDAAVAVAKEARTAVVFAWSGLGAWSGLPSSLSLPEEQDELIERVAAANPRTVVVLNTGGAVLMPWKDKVRAILEMWYPGQEGGWATADLLLGRANPGGRLPVTFPARLDDSPARAAGHPERLAAPGQPPNPEAPAVVFSEGIAVGYRWYDQQGIDPLFPFGHGLSYTQFEYSGLQVSRDERGVDVGFTLRNTGARRGSEVPQVYLGPTARPPVAMAARSLAGFERVELSPGGSIRVNVHIAPRQLCYWSTGKHDWVTAGGERPLWVGSSARDIRLEGAIPCRKRRM